jgi:hypothetical protein
MPFRRRIGAATENRWWRIETEDGSKTDPFLTSEKTATELLTILQTTAQTVQVTMFVKDASGSWSKFA